MSVLLWMFYCGCFIVVLLLGLLGGSPSKDLESLWDLYTHAMRIFVYLECKTIDRSKTIDVDLTQCFGPYATLAV